MARLGIQTYGVATPTVTLTKDSDSSVIQLYSDAAQTQTVAQPATPLGIQGYYFTPPATSITATLLSAGSAVNSVSAVWQAEDQKVLTPYIPVKESTAGRYQLAATSKGAELAAATLATTQTATVTTTFSDIPGLAVAPVIGTNGIYVDVIGSFGTVGVATLIIQLYDVTASAAVCQQTLVTVAGATGLPVAMRARLAPAAGARSYKVQWKLGSGSDTAAAYGTDNSQATGVFVTER